MNVLDQLSGCNLSDWEEEFVRSLADKFASYGDEAFYSETQSSKLQQLVDKYDAKLAPF